MDGKAPPAPKRKTAGTLFPRELDHRSSSRLQNGEPVLDSDIRRALAAFRNRFSETKEE